MVEVHEFLDWEIEETVDLLTQFAKEIGDRFNAGRPENGRAIAPNAYKASTEYHAVEIIRSLQAKIKVLESKVDNWL